MKRLFTLLFCVLLCICPLISSASEVEEVDPAAIEQSIWNHELEISGCAELQQWLDGPLSDNAGVSGNWYALALLRGKTDLDFSSYASALCRYAADTAISSATERERIALALTLMGTGEEYISAVMQDAIGQQGIMSYIYGLHLITNSSLSSPFTSLQLVEELLSLQLSDGGWALSGDTADADVTAMTLQALAPYCDTDDAVTSAVEKALSRLSSLQLQNGGFRSYGNDNPESASQVILALCALKIDPLTDARFIKNGNTVPSSLLRFQKEGGGFSHKIDGAENDTATVQVLLAMQALQRLAEGRNPLFVFAGEEITILPSAHRTPNFPLWKIVSFTSVMLFAVIFSLLTAIRHRGKKNYAFIWATTALLLFGVYKLNIQSASTYYSSSVTPSANSVTTYLTIRCDTVAGNKDYIPANGVILDRTAVSVPEGASAYDQLVAAVKANNIQMETTNGMGLVYVKGIAYIYEYDFGDLSGWMFRVNGVFSDEGCGKTVLLPGDEVEWLYTCDLGLDLEDKA